jgi:cytochrome c oxidase subunit 2
MMATPRFVAPAAIATALVALAGCGANASSVDLDLSPLGAEGRAITRSNGCASCHGTAGQGGVGPPFVGLFGSEVELDDGTTVVADAAYITESIKDPGAKQVAGYRLPMPSNNLTDEQITAVIAYIEDLSRPKVSP